MYFWSRLVHQKMVTGWQWESSTMPSPILGTPWNMTMGWSSPQSKIQSSQTKHVYSPPPRDKDQDESSSHCAVSESGGWWYKHCTNAHLTGQLTTTRTPGHPDAKFIYYGTAVRGGGHRYDWDSWKEVQMIMYWFISHGSWWRKYENGKNAGIWLHLASCWASQHLYPSNAFDPKQRRNN